MYRVACYVKSKEFSDGSHLSRARIHEQKEPTLYNASIWNSEDFMRIERRIGAFEEERAVLVQRIDFTFYIYARVHGRSGSFD